MDWPAGPSTRQKTAMRSARLSPCLKMRLARLRWFWRRRRLKALPLELAEYVRRSGERSAAVLDVRRSGGCRRAPRIAGGGEIGHGRETAPAPGRAGLDAGHRAQHAPAADPRIGAGSIEGETMSDTPMTD